MNKRLRHLTCLLLLFSLTGVAQDRTFKGYRIFINPGHGGHDADDRHILETNFWESEGNLEKGTTLKNLLEQNKATVFMSRTSNTSADDLDFAVIDEMANAANVDVFLSIHSNGGSGKTNRPLTLFRGYDAQPVYKGAKALAGILWQNLFENGNGWTHSEPYFKGDWSFYPEWGKQGLGVLRNLAVPGVLTEGSFHDYLPESWRMKNPDYLHHEALVVYRSLKQFYGISKPEDGVVAGIVRDSTKKAVWKTAKNSPDSFEPINRAKISLSPGKKTYTTDSQKNGFFLFEGIEPGEYTVEVEFEAPDSIRKKTIQITVEADKTTHTDVYFSKP